MALTRYPVNPDYGQGIYRRRVRLIGEGRATTAILNDDFHAMWCRLHHDGEKVLSVDAELTRIPKSTCPGAGLALRELVGMRLDVSRRDLYGDGRTGRNCTHLLDMGLLALGHAARGGGACMMDVVIPDERNGVFRLQGLIDGRIVHDWTARSWIIQSPSALSGLPVFSGFSRWAEERFAGAELDLARMIQKGCFVSRGRRYIVDQQPGRASNDEVERTGDCFSFSTPNIDVAVDNVGYVRDFRHGVVEVFPADMAIAPFPRPDSVGEG